MPNDLEVIETTLPAPLRNPKEILEEAGERAKALKDMVKQTGCSKRIGNKEHLQIEAWATIGNFYGCTAAADEATPFELDGIKGAKAHARVIHKESGRVISEAISYCLRDEDNWAHKPFFQLSSMAQTRACSKALANAFRWVVVMAGYATTPAEEMTGLEYDRKPVPQVRPRNDATMVQPPTDKYTGEQQQENSAADKLVQSCGESGWAAIQSPQQVSEAPAPSSAAQYALDMAQQAEKNEHTAEGYIGSHTPRLAGKQAPPGRFTLDTLKGELTLQYWDRPKGLGEPNHSYAKVTYRQVERAVKGGKVFTNNELLKLEWAAPPA